MNPETQRRLATLDQEIRQKQKEMRALLRESTSEDAVEEFTFQTTDGEVSLSELFGDHDDLIVIHNMGASCPYCTLWADGFIGLLPHLQSRAAVALCSPDRPEDQVHFASQRGWPFTMISDPDKEFATAMGYAFERQGKDMLMPGFSSFHRDEDGTIRRVGHAPFGPGDSYNAAWHFFEMLEDGPDGWQPKFQYPGSE